jgi:hypothetical protein
MRGRITGSALVAVPALAVLGLAAAVTVAPGARAEIEGPCQASIAGQSVAALDTGPRSEPIEVREKARVQVSMSSTRPITRLVVELEFGGLRWSVHDAPTEGTTWTRVVDVADYSKYGVGLYKVVGTSEGRAFSCTGAALVDVQGSALRKPAGIAGLAAAIVGAIGVLRLLFRRRASGAAPFVGAFFGLLLGAGVGVLLQQLSIVYPTALVAVMLLGGGLALGILSGFWGQRTGRAY